MIDIAIIPARAGSLGLPGKNTAKLGDFPLITWTIRAAQMSGVFSRIIVSTDGEEIAEIADATGAEVPFIRPSYLATPTARSIDVITHVLNYAKPEKDFALLQPTSPFRNAFHLTQAAKKYLDSPSNSLVSIADSKPINWQFNLGNNDQLISSLRAKETIYRRQDVSSLYVLNGAIYFCSIDDFRRKESLIYKDTIGYKMSRIDSIDIDYEEDLILAQAIVNAGLREID